MGTRLNAQVLALTVRSRSVAIAVFTQHTALLVVFSCFSGFCLATGSSLLVHWPAWLLCHSSCTPDPTRFVLDAESWQPSTARQINISHTGVDPGEGTNIVKEVWETNLWGHLPQSQPAHLGSAVQVNTTQRSSRTHGDVHVATYTWRRTRARSNARSSVSCCPQPAISDLEVNQSTAQRPRELCCLARLQTSCLTSNDPRHKSDV